MSTLPGPIILTERSRPMVRECSVCARDIVPENGWYKDVAPETDPRLAWVHVETSRRTHTGICISVLYAAPKQPEEGGSDG